MPNLSLYVRQVSCINAGYNPGIFNRDREASVGISINMVEGLGAYSGTKVLTYMVSDRPKQSLKMDY